MVLAVQMHWWDQFPGLIELGYFLGAVALIALIVWYARGGAALATNGFVIRVDGDDVQFAGRFPAHMQATVADFLRHDVNVPQRYEIRGRWEENLLIVVVIGDAARGVEQRIRNFLKLNLKRP